MTYVQKKNLFLCQVKAAFTRAYNKECLATPYAASLVKKAKSDESELMEAAMGEDGEEGKVEEPEDNDDVATDAMIKVGVFIFYVPIPS